MANAIVNTVFKMPFRVSGESAATLNAKLYDVDGIFVANKTLNLVNGNYVFSHTFPVSGVFILEVIDSAGGKSYGTVVAEGAISIDIADVQTALTNQGLTTVRSAKLDNLDAAISAIPDAVLDKPNI